MPFLKKAPDSHGFAAIGALADIGGMCDCESLAIKESSLMRYCLPLLLVSLLGAAASRPAAADMQVRLPHVVWREVEFEHNGLITFGPKGTASDRAQSYTNSIASGVTPWWKIELEGEMTSGGGQHLVWAATTFENTFALTERGQYMFDVGFFAEYSQATGLAPNEVKFGPILHKELLNVFGSGIDTAHTLNIFFSRDVGGNATRRTGLNVAWQSVARFHPWSASVLAPGFEYYANIEDFSHAGSYNQQRHFVGPVLTGTQSFSPYGKLKYQVGYLFGLSNASPKGAVRWKLEYEISF